MPNTTDVTLAFKVYSSHNTYPSTDVTTGRALLETHAHKVEVAYTKLTRLNVGLLALFFCRFGGAAANGHKIHGVWVRRAENTGKKSKRQPIGKQAPCMVHQCC